MMKNFSDQIVKYSNLILILFIALAIGIIYSIQYMSLSDDVLAILLISSGLFIIMGIIIKVLLMGFSIIVKSHEILIKEKISSKK